MQLEKGDRVKFLNDTGSGVITRINDSKTATVLIDEGFEVPMRLSELIPVGKSAQPDRPYEYSAPGKDASGDSPVEATGKPGAEDAGFRSKFERGSGSLVTGGVDDINALADYATDPDRGGEGAAERNLLLAFVASEERGGFDTWLINDSSFNAFYTFLLKQGDDDTYLNLKTGMIEPDTKLFIKTFDREQINNFLTLRVQALFFSGGIFKPLAPAQKEYFADPSDLFGTGSMNLNEFFDEEARIIPLISDAHERELVKISEQEISRLIAGKKDGPKSDLKDLKKDVRKDDPLTEEVDLHIEELTDDHAGLSGREVLDIQMARFTTALEGALRGKTKRLVFIHGVGNGKLKFEIRKTLDKKYPRLRYQDASFSEYGYGATMVIIRK